MELVEDLSDKLTFYRLEGMRFIAVVDNLCRDDKKELMERIRTIVAGRYGVSACPYSTPAPSRCWNTAAETSCPRISGTGRIAHTDSEA